MTTGLEGKVAIVTGGSRGIGKAVALQLAQEGVRLALCARDEMLLKQTADEIQSQTHADILAVKTNVTRLNDVRRFVAAVAKKFTRIDILVNNAGAAQVGDLFTITDEDWDYHIALKLLGYIRVTREVVAYMKESGGGGKIINIIGMAGKEPNPLFMLPGVINGALMNFTKSLSKSLEPHRIYVNAVNPGTTDTALTEEMLVSLSAQARKPAEEIRRALEQSSPLGRLATAEEVARMVVVLASDISILLNGISVNVDAGKSLGPW